MAVAGGTVHLLTLTQGGELEIIITKHKGLSVMGGESLTLADGAASWTIKAVRTERRNGHEPALIKLIKNESGMYSVNILLKLGVVTNVT